MFRLPTRTKPEFNEQSYFAYMLVGVLPAIAFISRPEPICTWVGLGYGVLIFLIMCWSHSEPIKQKKEVKQDGTD